MPILVLLIVGVAAGFLAVRLMKIQADTLTTIAVGILGALVGGLILRGLMLLFGLAAGFIGALLGAMMVLWLWQRYGPRA